MPLTIARLAKYPETRLIAMGLLPHQIRAGRVFGLLMDYGAEPTDLESVLLDYNDAYHPYDPNTEDVDVLTRNVLLGDLRKLCAEGAVLRDETRKTYYVAASDQAQARINELKAAKAESEKPDDPKPGGADEQPIATS